MIREPLFWLICVGPELILLGIIGCLAWRETRKLKALREEHRVFLLRMPVEFQRIYRDITTLGYHIEDGKDGRNPSILCATCGRTSYSVDDIRHLYCGYCHKYHKQP